MKRLRRTPAPPSLSPAIDTVRAVCAAHPATASLTLARMILRQHPGLFPTLNAARHCVRRERGRKTDRLRDREPIASTAPRVPWDPRALLPASDERAFEPFEIAVARDTQALVLSDIHLPYHSLEPLSLAFRHGRERDCKIVILNGDTLDFHRLSRFQKDPRARSAEKEIAAAGQLLDAIDAAFPRARKIWKDGNHDERYAHYLAASLPELATLIADHAGLSRLLGLADRGWEYVTDKRVIQLGKLPLLHGHEYPTPVIGPVNAARGLFLRTKASALVGHHHQTSEHTEPTLHGKMITTWSTGCLCDLHPAYAPFNRWNHGFATVDLARNGDFRVRNMRVQGSKLLN